MQATITIIFPRPASFEEDTKAHEALVRAVIKSQTQLWDWKIETYHDHTYVCDRTKVTGIISLSFWDWLLGREVEDKAAQIAEVFRLFLNLNEITVHLADEPFLEMSRA